jgi:phosphoenolpyruvate-protein phosphotransferase/dihydroxyacetone kinase phosphotransfer subunit
MVGIVVVSHSEQLAAGVVELARQMAGERLALEAAGGIGEPGVLGTDAERVREAIVRAMSKDGVLVLMDLGSALMSAELAVSMLAEPAGPVRLLPAPLVEGAVAAAAAAAGGASLDQVAAEAQGALAMKAAQLSEEPAGGAAGAQDAPSGADARDARPDPGGGDQRTTPPAQARLRIRNPVGLHARPAARFVQAVGGFDASVRVRKLGEQSPPLSASSLTNLLSLGARLGDMIELQATGPEAREALAALEALAESGFGEGVVAGREAPARAIPPADVSAAPARPLEPGEVLVGVPAGGGIAVGPARPAFRAFTEVSAPAGTAEQERERLRDAIAQARAAIADDRRTLAARVGAGDADILTAHLALLEDEALLQRAEREIERGASAEQAIDRAAEQLAERLRALPDRLLRERAGDLGDVAGRVLAALRPQIELGSAEGVVLVEEPSPAQAARLDPGRVLALAAARGSPTAHGAILARGLGLPTVLGLGDRLLAIAEGSTVIVDGDAGTVTVDPAPERLREARLSRERRLQRRTLARERAHEPAITRDGAHVEVCANIGSVAQAREAVALGADGVGLLRTEFMFLERDELPDELEQAQALREIALALGERPLTIRTLDAGADKPLPALALAPEQNPFLGVRGIRVGLRDPQLLLVQLRAILRVGAQRPLRVMLPMVSALSELVQALKLLALAREQTGLDAPLELGIMVEVPAAALLAERLAAHARFFSIGTNDLAQYTFAAERGDERLAPLACGPQPALLRLIELTVAGARAHRRPVAVCGELAGDPALAPLLVGLGVGELSVAPGLVGEVKAALRGVTLARARRAARAALAAQDAVAARAVALELL